MHNPMLSKIAEYRPESQGDPVSMQDSLQHLQNFLFGDTVIVNVRKAGFRVYVESRFHSTSF